MITNITSSSVTKVGRVRYDKAFRDRVIAEFERVGGSALAFAKCHDIAYHCFLYWLKIHRQRQVRAVKPDFVELKLKGSFVGFSVSLGEGVSIEVSEMGQLRGVVALLKEFL
jgi:hypothetical protein